MREQAQKQRTVSEKVSLSTVFDTCTLPTHPKLSCSRMIIFMPPGRPWTPYLAGALIFMPRA